MKNINKKTARQQLKDLCQAHSELESANEKHSKNENKSNIVNQIYLEQLDDLGRQIIAMAKILFADSDSVQKVKLT